MAEMIFFSDDFGFHYLSDPHQVSLLREAISFIHLLLLFFAKSFFN